MSHLNFQGVFFLAKNKIFLICTQRSSLRSLLYNATFWVDFQTLWSTYLRVEGMTKDRSKIEMSREEKKKLLECRWKRLFKSQGKFASTKIKSRVCILHAYYYFLAHWFFGKYILNFKTTLTRSQKKNLRGPAIQIALKLKMSTAYCEKAAFHDCFFSL